MLETTIKEEHIKSIKMLIDFRLEHMNNPTIKDYFDIHKIVELMKKLDYTSEEIKNVKIKYGYLYGRINNR